MDAHETKSKGLELIDMELFDISRGEVRACPKHGEYLAPYAHISANQCPHCGAEMIEADSRSEYSKIIQDARKARIQAVLSQSVIPKRCAEASLKINPPGALSSHLHVIARMRKLVENFEKVKAIGASALVHGKPGTGKTWMACAVVLALVEQGRRAVYTTQTELGSLARESHRDHQNESERRLIQRFSDYEFLVVDELGSGKNSEPERKTISEILIARHDSARPTVVCTNIDAVTIEKEFGDRLADRITAWVDIPCDWLSYRGPADLGLF